MTNKKMSGHLSADVVFIQELLARGSDQVMNRQRSLPCLRAWLLIEQPNDGTTADFCANPTVTTLPVF